ncbi:MAG: hypothetical protein J7L63_01220 [Thermoplasmata archaeon]|nr:hypothetical protein [Thermoplasmata archaeon]
MRRYSGSLIHGDWHKSDENKPYVIVRMDDASHKKFASLWLEIGENPRDAFIRKAPPESLLGIFLSISNHIAQGGDNHAFL